MGVKEFWKANKWGYLTSGIVITLGCLFLYAKNKARLIITILFGWFGLLFFMFMFGLSLGGLKD